VRNGIKTANFMHKWLALLVGAQVLVWLFSGLYMVLVDIDFIHGDPLVKNTRQVLAPETLPALKLAELSTAYPGASELGVKPVLGRPFYTVTTPQARYLIEASSARVVSPLRTTMATDIARYHYRGDAKVAKASLITSDAPMEVGARALPLWRIDFDDRLATSFYIDPYSGALVTRRHLYWRIFDFLWMLHIMDYGGRSDIHHPLLWSAQVAGLLLAVTGAWLLMRRIGRRKKRPGPEPA
jgi:uncharacterized iron-regulated membrane protein